MTSFKRAAGVVAVAALLASSTAYAAELAPLPAGKPAGTHQAALLAVGPIFWIGLAALAVGIGFAASNNGNNSTGATSTGTNA